MEAIRDNNNEEGLDYLNKEIKENAKNGYAYIWIAVLRAEKKEYGRALSAINFAIKCLPKEDTEYLAAAYRARSDIYTRLNETDKAIDDISKAIKYNPENEDYYETRAQLYYQQDKYDLSDKDYKKMIELDEGNLMGYMGIGRNANEQERYADAIKQFDYVIRMHSDFSSGYSFRAESYIGLKKYNEAIDDVIMASDIDRDDKAFGLMLTLADSAFVTLVTKFKVQQAKQPTDAYWSYCLGSIHERKSVYTEAAEFYKQCMKMNPASYPAYRIANCLHELGLYEQALNYIEQGKELIQEDNELLMDCIRLGAIIKNDAGRETDAIEDMGVYIEEYPDFYFAYYQRGWFKDHNGDLKGALEDYSTSITLEPEYNHCYLNRGVVNNLLGNTQDAVRDFEQILIQDTVPDKNSIRQYAYLYLGQTQNAIEWQNKILSEYNDKGELYDAACLYSIMGEKEKAISYLRQALDKGYRRFAHINRDRDMNNIRELPEFKALIKEFTLKHEEEQSMGMDEQHDYIEKVTEVPFTSEGGVYKVKCTINDLPLHFIFDTGASDVSMSTVEATFMLKNDYLSPKDILGKQNYITATGEISEGTAINLRNVSFGGHNLTNVKASIVKNQKAPLLLGQSVLNKLGVIEIDNQKKVLKITHKEKIKH